MARLIDTARFAGAQMTGAGLLARLTLWETGPDGTRLSRHLTGDEAEEAATEIRDLLGGTSEPDVATVAVAVKTRKRKEKV